jgi:hypothetical protein
MSDKSPMNPEALPAVDVPGQTPVTRQRRVSKVLPPGYSWLSVPIRTNTLNNLNIQARRSNMSLREYMDRFCREAVPYDGSTCPDDRAPESGQASAKG